MPIVFTDTPTSSAISRIGYDPLTSELRIVFKDKSKYPEYIWGGVDLELAQAFLFSGSKGAFYHNNLKARREFRISRALGSFRLGAVRRRVAKTVFSTRS